MRTYESLLPYKEHLNEIKEALSADKAYLFIGSGFSKNAEPKTVNVQSSFKTWTAFMNQLANKLWPELSDADVEQKVAGNHLYIAQLYEEEFGISGFYKELLQAIPYKDYMPSFIHKQLIGLEKWKGFITTNQDCLIEQTLDELHIYHDVVISDLDISTKPANTKVFKIHGSMERPESIIFTEEQYRTYEQKHPLLHVKVKSIFAEHCVVFVGFSLTDANFKTIYGWVKDVLQSDYQRKAYAFVFENEIDAYTKRYWEKRNIILLPIFTKSKNPSSAFQESLEVYIDEFKNNSQLIEDSKDFTEIYKLLDQEVWLDETVKNFVDLLDSVPNGSNPVFGDKFISFLKKQDAQLEAENLLIILDRVYQKGILSPFFTMNGKKLIDRIIELLEDSPHSKNLLYQYLLAKSEFLLNIGKHDEAEQHTKKILTNYPKLPNDIRNSLIYIQIIIEKYRMNFEQIYLLIGQLVLDQNQPIWLNRVASSYLLLGEKSIALNYYNQAIQVAVAKKDVWNLYLAYLSKWYLLNDFFGIDSFQENERYEVQQSVQRLSQHLKDTKHSTYMRWQQLDELKAKWLSDYKVWKSQLGENRSGFNSSKKDSEYAVYNMILFLELHGFPHLMMIGKKFDVILDIFIENNKRVKGTAFSTLLGHDKQIKHAFRFETLVNISDDERALLFSQGIQFTKNIIWYIRTLRNDSYTSLVELWSSALGEFWIQFIPILKDEEIELLATNCMNLFDLIHDFPQIDRFRNVRGKLITLMVECLFYREQSINKMMVIDRLRSCMNDFRLVNAFLTLNWHDFKKGLIPNDVVEGLIHHIETSSVNLIYQWLDNDLLSEEQKRIVYERIYGEHEQSQENESLQKARLFYLQYFKEQVDDNIIRDTIEFAVHQYQSHHSSTNGNELYHLGENVEFLEENYISEIIDASEKKMNVDKNNSNWFKVNLSGKYIYFIFKLWKAGKIEDSKLEQELSNTDHLEIEMATLIGELAKENQFTGILSNMLLESSYAFQINLRKNALFLIGFWLKERTILEKAETLLLERLLVGLEDSNVDVSSEAVRGVAFLLKDNPSIIPTDLIERIITVTERGIYRNEISYLTNLAFLYSELSKLITLPITKKEIVNKVLTQLSNSNYSNVRRECRLKD